MTLGGPIRVGGKNVIEVATIGMMASRQSIGSGGATHFYDTIIYDPDGVVDLDNNAIIAPEDNDNYMVLANSQTIGGEDGEPPHSPPDEADKSYGSRIRIEIDGVDTGIKGNGSGSDRAGCCVWVFPLSISEGQLITAHVTNTASNGGRKVIGGAGWDSDNWRPTLSVFLRPDVTDDDFQYTP